METTVQKWVGRELPRHEDARFLAGKGKYIADYALPGMAYLSVVRSTHAHARIRAIDTTKAERYPGVIAVVTGPEVAAAMKPLLVPSIIPNLGGELQVPIVYPLAVDKVFWVGDPIAAVVAEDKYIAEDAAELVEIEYEPLPALVDPEVALLPDAPRLYDEWRSNILWHGILENGDVDAAFRDADYVFKQRFYMHRTGAAPMETRGALASFDDFSGLTLYINTQRPHILRMALSDILDITHDKVHVIAPKDVGGAFGTKAPIYREDVLISYLAMRLGRPVKWVENRMESLMTIGQERDQIHYLEVAVRKDGKILGLKDRMIADNGDGRIGVYLGFVMPWLGAAYLTNAYDIPNVRIDLSSVVTNKPSLTPSRSFGEFPGRFAMDYAMHLIARRLAIDPRLVYKRNIIKTFPYVSATGIMHDSGDYQGVFRKLVEVLNYDGVKAEQAEARRQGRFIGVGFALGCEMSGLGSKVFVPMENQPGYGSAIVKIDARGMVQVIEGDSPQGQGHETTFAQVVADELGVQPDDVYVDWGDTFVAPFASGTLGNRGSSYTVSAVVVACRKLKGKLVEIARHLLMVGEEEEFVFADGKILLKSDVTRFTTLKVIADAAIMAPTKLPPGMEAGLEASAYFEPDVAGMMSISGHGAVVEVNPITGQFTIRRYVVVDDCGTAINPMLVRGQIHGGVVLGVGNTLYERYVYDENGQPLSTTLMEYHIPSSADVPMIETVEHNVPTPHTPLGTKGKGEGIPAPVAAALASAITDAMDRPSFRLPKLPLTPESIWRALRDAAEEEGGSGDWTSTA